MKLALLTALATLALAVPAAADDATLEGYGGDGALLVGIDNSGPQFGNDPAPGKQPKPGDGNLVAEKAPSSSGGTQGVTVTPTQPSTTAPAPTDTTTAPAGERKRQQQRDERKRERESRDQEPGSSSTPAPEARREPAPRDAEGPSGGAGLPFSGNELILLLAGLLGLAAIGAGMRRLLVLQPRI